MVNTNNITSCWCNDNDPDHDEGYLLRPDGHVDVEPKPVDQNVESLCDRVDLAHTVEHNVDGRDEDLPDAVGREEIAEDVKVFALQGSWPFHTSAHIL